MNDIVNSLRHLSPVAFEVGMEKIKTKRKDNYFEAGAIPYTPISLIDEILDNIPAIKEDRFDVKIAILYTIEIAFNLVWRGFTNITIIVGSHDEHLKGMCDKINIKYIVIDINEEQNMPKFDVVVGNPPYQDSKRTEQANKLWPVFIKMANIMVNDNGFVAMITPNNWMQPTADIGKGSGKNSLSIFNDIFKTNNLILANIDSDNLRKKYFAGVGSTFSYFIYQHNTYSGLTKFITESGEVDVDISKIEGLPRVISSESLSICQKMVGQPFNFCDQNHGLNGNEKELEGGLYVHKIYHTNKNGGTFWYGEQINPYSKKPKVIISLSGKYLPVYNNTTGFSNMCLSLICTSDTEAKQANAILSSKLYTFWVEMHKFSGFNPRKLILNLPAVSTNENWTDEKLYKYFKLTPNEIKLIEEVIK